MNALRILLVAFAAWANLSAAPAAAEAPRFHAAEIHRVTRVETAAIRNNGSDELRLTVWYPASAGVAETPISIGDPADPIFKAGSAAPDAAWADNTRRPLVLMSHGFGGVARQLTWLGTALARAGYVVVAVDHPGTNGRDGITREGVNLFWERATDMRAALDYVLADTTLAAHVDVKRIGAAGFSLGGYTTALLAGARSDMASLERFCDSPKRDAICNPQVEYSGSLTGKDAILDEPRMQPFLAREKLDQREPRVRAAFLMAPAIVQGIGAKSLAKVRIPVAVLTGSDDPVVPAETNANVLATGIPDAKLITLPKVGHYDFLSECGASGLRVAAIYCADGTGTKRADTHTATVEAALKFFGATLN